ncbi:hypothetical protein [Pectinatus frisingensis]|uniref:hypothetical protein n=1 Tax=Pectinatus frisingensis TaxID=865 RepID=UPI0018C7DA14|nr:hypothetical protein [Pectinatus frisingensis]
MTVMIVNEKSNEGVCPMLDTDWPTKCNLSRNQIENFCNLGCSPICSDLFLERWGAKLDNKKAAQCDNTEAV